MNELGLLPSASPEQQGDSLWDQAPAWRKLVIGASMLTFVTAALPVLLPQAVDNGIPPVIVAVAPTAQIQSQIHTATETPQMAASTQDAPGATPDAIPAPMPAPAPLVTTPAIASVSANAPSAQAVDQANICPLVLPSNPNLIGNGVVTSLEDRATSMARIQRTQAKSGGRIDPDYIDNQRVTVQLRDGDYRVLLVPRTMQVSVGDVVTMQSNYRNVNLPCNYVPNLIVADLGPRTNGMSPVIPVETSP